jgi:hypothetical protein
METFWLGTTASTKQKNVWYNVFIGEGMPTLPITSKPVIAASFALKVIDLHSHCY